MKTQNKFWWFVAVALAATVMALCTISVLFWQQLNLEQKTLLLTIFKESFAYFFTLLVLLFTVLGFALDWVFRFYIIPVNQIADETRLLYTVNPSHKINVDGSHDLMRLAEIVNENAKQQAEFRKGVETQLQMAKKETEAERNILAAMLEDLPQGILVCNMDGVIVFYNRKIKGMLTQHQLSETVGPEDMQRMIGLGRSIFSFIDKNLVMPALDRIAEKLSIGHPVFSERFLLETQAKMLLPAQLLPVLDSQHHLSGFILYIEDQLERHKRDEEFSKQLLAWQHEMTQAVSVIKSTSELLNDEAEEMSTERRTLIGLVAKQAEQLANLLKRRDITNRWSPDQPWPLTPIDAIEWLHFLAYRTQEVVNINLEIDAGEPTGQISIDIHHLTCAVMFILSKVRRYADVASIRSHLYAKESWVYLDFHWEGKPIDGEMLARWKQDIARREAVELTIPLKEILSAHGAKLWAVSDGSDSGRSGLRLLIPMIEDAEIVMVDGLTTVLPDSRPEFYDFDLFKSSFRDTGLDDRLLSELSFTVFDTETTGLDPQGGDEIISIGAVRIVNGRLLVNEKFDQLINPDRNLPWASVKYHGIRPEMLVDQPYISEVLPRFHAFAQGTVLVGHNVAFDMRMLEMKEHQTGIAFTNPILDTMLLSDIVHPAHRKHNLQAVADRLGVRITGRHTALGDSIATGEIFLRLIPLLAAQGIKTLREARQTSQKSLYARLKY